MQNSRIRFICNSTKQKLWRLSHCPQNTYSRALKSFHSPDPTLTGRLHLMNAWGNTLHTIHYIFLMWHEKSPRRTDILGICERLNISYYLVTADGLVLSLIWTGGHYWDRKQTWWVMKVQAKWSLATSNLLTVVFYSSPYHTWCKQFIHLLSISAKTAFGCCDIDAKSIPDRPSSYGFNTNLVAESSVESGMWQGLEEMVTENAWNKSVCRDSTD